MNDYEHPPWPARHKPTITTAEVGAQVTCACGWSATAPNAPRATRAFVSHLRDEKASEGGAR